MLNAKVNLNTIDKVKNFVNQISHTDLAVDLAYDRYLIDAKSIMGIFSLDLSRTLTMIVHTNDEKQFTEIIELVKDFIVN